MEYKKYRWSKDYEAAEEELELLLDVLRHEVSRCEAEAMETITSKFSAPARIWCAEGSIKLYTGQVVISLQPGDALDMLSGAPDEATAGVAGCVWYVAI